MRLTVSGASAQSGVWLQWLRRAIDDRGENFQYLHLPDQFLGLQEQPGYVELLNYLGSIQKSQ
ncbi:MAG: hypothetical protein ABW110_23705 [Steroidobacteraceae bacterium]